MDTGINLELLTQTYNEVATILRNHQIDGDEWAKWKVPEPFEATLGVERHRWYWRPTEIKIVLLAESHLFTDQDDLACRIKTSELPIQLSEYPSEFVRLVHCIGYGHDVLQRRPRQANSGTPEYWEILGRCAGTWDTSDDNLEWKIRTLQTLQRKGIWLVDASIHACCNPRLTGKACNLGNKWGLYRAVLQTSWMYVSQNIRGCQGIWCIGHNVNRALRDPRIIEAKTILQPSAARFGRHPEYREGLERLVAGVQSVS